MKIKRYKSPTMKLALQQVRDELGEEAVILHSKKLSDRAGGEQYEVTAAVDEFDRPTLPNPPKPKAGAIPSSEPVAQNPGAGQWKSASELSALNSEVRELKSALQQMTERMKFPQMPKLSPALNKLYLSLMNAGLGHPLAQEFVQTISGSLNGHDPEQPGMLQGLLREWLAEKIQISPASVPREGQPTVIALVGPTGVGKTTTLAKLATHPALYGNSKVAFISADTYRIAAIEQLRTFAQIAKIPMEVIYSADEVGPALLRHHDKDVIFIDTPGRSPYSGNHLREMRTLMERAQPDEIHLVLNVSLRHEDARDIIGAYGRLGVNRLLFTKADETCSAGSLLNVAAEFGPPLSYITNGQDVPDDIKRVTSNYLVSLLLKDNEIQ